MSTTRRQFLATAGSFALAGAGKGTAGAAMGPNDKFDLVIKGGDVLDPSQSLRGRRDIGIRFGVIEALEADIPVARAQRVLDAAGKLVTPGLGLRRFIAWFPCVGPRAMDSIAARPCRVAPLRRPLARPACTAIATRTGPGGKVWRQRRRDRPYTIQWNQ
jgi:hypothetical protein